MDRCIARYCSCTSCRNFCLSWTCICSTSRSSGSASISVSTLAESCSLVSNSKMGSALFRAVSTSSFTASRSKFPCNPSATGAVRKYWRYKKTERPAIVKIATFKETMPSHFPSMYPSRLTGFVKICQICLSLISNAIVAHPKNTVRKAAIVNVVPRLLLNIVWTLCRNGDSGSSINGINGRMMSNIVRKPIDNFVLVASNKTPRARAGICLGDRNMIWRIEIIRW